MKNFKDFLYNANDILIAMGIILIAALIIFWRMDVIMDYPQTINTEVTEENTNDGQNDDTEANSNSDTGKIDTNKTGDDSKDSGTNIDKTTSSNDSNALWLDGALTKSVSVTIKGGSATSAVQCLIDAGLFKDFSSFEDICTKAGYKLENIKAGSFEFSKGTTRAQIAKKVTQ